MIIQSLQYHSFTYTHIRLSIKLLHRQNTISASPFLFVNFADSFTLMYHYLSLQLRFLNRHLAEFGIKPIFGYFLGSLLFAALTAYLWYVTEYAVYIYALLGLSFTTMTADPAKLTFMRQHFPVTLARQIRITENVLVVIPFTIGLLIYQEWLIALVLIALAMMMSFSSINTSMHLVIPTPFHRYPFEFTAGVRNSLLFLMTVSFLLIMAVVYANPNLGLFSCALVLLLCLSFYMSSEPAYLVWIHSMNPSQFLLHKISISAMYATLLVAPFAIVQVITFPSQALYLLVIWLLGLLYLATTILARYAFYPMSMNLPQGIMLALTFWFPPLLLFLIPYLYRRCLHSLQPMLT